jgi:hypothetical protein
MTEELPEAYSLMCSGCHSPCSGADAHVIPRWNPTLRKVLTTYRCSNCWVTSLNELRAQVTSGEAEVRASFWVFLARHGFTKDAQTIRVAPSEEQEATLLAILDAVQAKRLIFEP